MLDTKIINNILGIEESYKAPSRLLELVLDDTERPKIFNQFLEHEYDMSYEWFQQYYESEHAERKSKAQDFSPLAVSKLLSRIVGGGNNYYEVAAGNGGILIQKWHEDRSSVFPVFYDPRAYWYTVEELSDRSLPFLIFNMSIRGMNGLILHGDSLTREFKHAYFIRNDSDDFMAFSEVIDMTGNELLAQDYNVKKWR